MVSTVEKTGKYHGRNYWEILDTFPACEQDNWSFPEDSILENLGQTN